MERRLGDWLRVLPGEPQRWVDLRKVVAIQTDLENKVGLLLSTGQLAETDIGLDEMLQILAEVT